MIASLIIGGAGYYAWTERDAISDFISAFLGTDTTDEAEAEGVVDDDAAGEEVAAGEEAAAVEEVAVVVEPPVFVDPAAGFYIEPADGSPETSHDAAVSWALDQDADFSPIIVAYIIVPDQRLRITLNIRKALESDIMSHEISLLVTQEEGFAGVRVQAVEKMAAKTSEEGIGVALDGNAFEAAGVFFIELLTEQERPNSNKLRSSPWFDLALVYDSGERAILSFSRGTPGDEIFAEVFAAWDA